MDPTKLSYRARILQRMLRLCVCQLEMCESFYVPQNSVLTYHEFLGVSWVVCWSFHFWIQSLRFDKEKGEPLLDDIEEALDEAEPGLAEKIDLSFSKLYANTEIIFVECEKLREAWETYAECPAEAAKGPIDKALEHNAAYMELIEFTSWNVRQAQWIKYRVGVDTTFIKDPERLKYYKCRFCDEEVERMLIPKHVQRTKACRAKFEALREVEDEEFKKWAGDRLPPTPIFNMGIVTDTEAVCDKIEGVIDKQEMAEKKKNMEKNHSIVQCQYCKKDFKLMLLPRHQIMEYQCYLDDYNHRRRLRKQYGEEVVYKNK